MIKEILNVEGPVIGFLDKLGQLIALSVMWMIGCLPVITIATSTTALYYAVTKSVRCGQGSAVKEFIRSYRNNLGRGIAVTIAAALVAALLIMNLRFLRDHKNPILSAGTVTAIAVLLFTGIYIGPVLSRFRLKFADGWKLAFVMAVRFIHYTLLILGGAGVLAMLQVYVLPAPTVLILPGFGCWLSTFLIEKALRRYMPAKEENDNTWYYET